MTFEDWASQLVTEVDLKVTLNTVVICSKELVQLVRRDLLERNKLNVH